MIEPDFCEAQLQQLVNMELTADFKRIGLQTTPIVRSLREELKLGWDTGFNVKGQPMPGPDTKGCNLFIQYKLAILMESRGGKFKFWRTPYFQYKIAYSKKNNGYTYNYNQLSALVALSNRNYSCFYISNNTTELDDIIKWSNTNQLIPNCCILDIGQIHDLHRFITYTQDSDVCLLSSEPNEAKKTTTFDTIFVKVKEGLKSSPEEDYKNFDMIFSDFPIWFKRVDRLLSYSGEFELDKDAWLVKLATYHKVLWDIFGWIWVKLYL